MKDEHDVVTLAIAPSSYGLGYVVFERADLVMDWGVKELGGNDKTEDCTLKVGTIMQLLQPELLIIEDVHHVSCRRWPEAKACLDAVAKLGKDRKIKVVRVSRSELEERFARAKAYKKYDIAVVVAKLLPELAPRLPKRRVMWDSEHYAMAIFEAAALAVTYFARSN